MFDLFWSKEAQETFRKLESQAKETEKNRQSKGKVKSSKQEGLFKQVVKTLQLLRENPRHPGLKTHQYHSLDLISAPGEKIFEAYVQNNTPGAYRVFWHYGPEKRAITILAITAHP